MQFGRKYQIQSADGAPPRRAARWLMAATFATMGAGSFCARAVATTWTWIGAGGNTVNPTTGSWNATGNWTNGSVPTSSTGNALSFVGVGGFTSTDDLGAV